MWTSGARAALLATLLAMGGGAQARDGLARWAELVSDGNAQVIEAVREVEGEPAKVAQLDTIMEVLSDAGHGVSADLKDDDSVELAIEDLNKARRLSGFKAPSKPAAGPGRCSATLLAFAKWVASRGYRLVPVDTGDADWNAVLVKAAHHEELLKLSTALGIGTTTPEKAYAESDGTRPRIGRRR